MEERKGVIMWDCNNEREEIIATLTTICNTIINSGTIYNEITIGDVWDKDGVVTTPWKRDDCTRIAQAIINTPSLTHINLYPLSK